MALPGPAVPALLVGKEVGRDLGDLGELVEESSSFFLEHGQISVG